MGISELHAAHIRRVSVAFVIYGPNLDPATVTDLLEIAPDYTARRGDERRNLRDERLTPHDEGIWRLDTMGKVESKDINDHLRYLLDRLLPKQEAIRSLAEENATSWDVLWESTYLYAGTGPLIERDCLCGLAQFNADLGFDIYQIDEDDEQSDE